MRSFAILVLFACLAPAAASTNKGAAIAKVVEMLNDMLAKGKKEKQDETVRFAAFKQFCESTNGEKTRDIAKGKAEIEQLEAEMAKANADAEEATKYIAGLDADVTQWTEDLKSARAEREKEHALFEEAHKATMSSIDAVARAHKMLKAGPGEAGLMQVSKDMTALLQTNRAHISKHAQVQLMSFLQKVDPGRALLQEAEEEGLPSGPPAAAAFEGSSGGIIDLVERLGDKFDDERIELEKREANSVSAFQMAQADLTGAIETAGVERGMKEKTKTTRLADAAAAKGDLADTSASLAEDEKFLADLNAECEQKSFDYQARQTVRQGEIEAIEKAIEIMSSPDVAGAGDKHLGLVQSRVSLVQLRSTVKSDVQTAVASFLDKRATQLGSRILALVADKAGSDPFVKVKRLIQQMITKLMDEAAEEAEHEAFCNEEMKTNKQTRDKKTSEADGLKADIEKFTADIAKLGSEITALGNELAELAAAVQKATKDRFEEKAKNQETLDDATTAAEATARALAILKEFYEKAAVPIEQPAPQQGPIAWDNRALQILETAKGGAAASFLQTDAQTSQKVPGAPEMEEGQYTGMANGGVLGLMEVVQSDFEKVIAETSASEADAAKIYDQFMADSDQDKAVKETDQKHKVASKQEKESALATANKDLMVTNDELAAAMAYYEKLKPDCEAKVVSYAEKVAAREAEIESLKEALTLLTGN